MGAAFGWLGDLFLWFSEFVPRWEIIRTTERGVKWVRGKKVKVLKPGIRWWWPVVTDIEIEEVVRQTLYIEPQTLMTDDGEAVIASGVVVFRITDIQKYLVENYDAAEAIIEVAGAAMRKVIIGKTLEAIQKGRADIDNALSKETQKLLQAFGVEVEYMRLVSFSKARILNIVGTQLLHGD